MTTSAVVNSHNEWDPLEEVIVGVLEGAVELPLEPAFEAVIPSEDLAMVKEYHRQEVGKPFKQIARAQAQLDELVRILEAEGVTIRRPTPTNFARPFATPEWRSVCGNNLANPRDVLIVFGDEILEAPMAWRSRYFEMFGYRDLLKEYFKRGAKWTAAPKPEMRDALYDPHFHRGESYVTTELEPVFDAADITRVGRDVFVQRSHVTNRFGIEWLARHLGERYRVHALEFDDDRAIHIDATFTPLAPGKLLVNPDRRIKQMPEMFEKSGWDILECPRSTIPRSTPVYRSFQWLSMNMLMLDEKRVICEKHEEPLIAALESWGFEPIRCDFRACYKYGGSFHCFTTDIRRRGTLQSYFND